MSSLMGEPTTGLKRASTGWAAAQSWPRKVEASPERRRLYRFMNNFPSLAKLQKILPLSLIYFVKGIVSILMKILFLNNDLLCKSMVLQSHLLVPFLLNIYNQIWKSRVHKTTNPLQLFVCACSHVTSCPAVLCPIEIRQKYVNCAFSSFHN